MLWLNPEKSYNPYHHALAGAVAGGAAATAALPLDACKTLLNTQEVQMQYWTQLDFPSLGECAQTAQCSKRDRSSRCSNNNIQDGWLLGLLSGSEGQNLLCDAWYCYFLVGTQIIDYIYSQKIWSYLCFSGLHMRHSSTTSAQLHLPQQVKKP